MRIPDRFIAIINCKSGTIVRQVQSDNSIDTLIAMYFARFPDAETVNVYELDDAIDCIYSA